MKQIGFAGERMGVIYEGVHWMHVTVDMHLFFFAGAPRSRISVYRYIIQTLMRFGVPKKNEISRICGETRGHLFLHEVYNRTLLVKVRSLYQRSLRCP